MGDHPLVRLALHPPLEGRLQLGATIAGTLDFRFSQEAAQQSSEAPKCVQVVVMLESEELVQDRWQAPSKRQAGPIRRVSYLLSYSCMLIVTCCLHACRCLLPYSCKKEKKKSTPLGNCNRSLLRPQPIDCTLACLLCYTAVVPYLIAATGDLHATEKHEVEVCPHA